MKKIGDILKSAREDLDLTQIDVMKKTGIHNKTLSGYENEVSQPDLETFATLMTVYQLSADEVLEIPHNRELSLTMEERSVIQNYRQLSERQQADFRTMLEALAQRNDRS